MLFRVLFLTNSRLLFTDDLTASQSNITNEIITQWEQQIATDGSVKVVSWSLISTT